MTDKPEVIQYRTVGTCCQLMQVAIQDGKVVDAEFIGGCNGNLKGISALVKNRPIDEIISLLDGIHCGPRSTSCPDQLAQGLKEIKLKENR